MGWVLDVEGNCLGGICIIGDLDRSRDLRTPERLRDRLCRTREMTSKNRVSVGESGEVDPRANVDVGDIVSESGDMAPEERDFIES